jgi:hypothetical protein
MEAIGEILIEKNSPGKGGGGGRPSSANHGRIILIRGKSKGRKKRYLPRICQTSENYLFNFKYKHHLLWNNFWLRIS